MIFKRLTPNFWPQTSGLSLVSAMIGLRLAFVWNIFVFSNITKISPSSGPKFSGEDSVVSGSLCLTFFRVSIFGNKSHLKFIFMMFSKHFYEFHAWKMTNWHNVDYTSCLSAVSSDLSFSRYLTRVWSVSEIGLVSDWYSELSDNYPPIRALSTLIRNSDSQSEVRTVTIILRKIIIYFPRNC